MLTYPKNVSLNSHAFLVAADFFFLFLLTDTFLNSSLLLILALAFTIFVLDILHVPLQIWADLYGLHQWTALFYSFQLSFANMKHT